MGGVDFTTSRLAAASLNLSEATQLFGVPIGRKYIQRVAVLQAVEKFAHLYGHRALRLHPLRGDRTGQYAITLTGNYRLIIERTSEETVRILSVEDYHGD
ncbi:MAG: type II toxin-antitoxin system RelE/ParE family toxin [Chloroflexi bacterium]|nr:type II toxin-antitoxin system RelE/ParE family toxin [Chloroflexota bacterium]